LVVQTTQIRQPTKPALPAFTITVSLILAYFPIDIKQTPDGGYLILGGRSVRSLPPFSGIYLLKVDAFGGFESEDRD
jgi:hypothetical protein